MIETTIGILLVAASFFVAVREILLRPQLERFPKAPFFLRLFLFGWVVALFFVGTSIIMTDQAGRPIPWPRLMLVLASATAVQTAAMSLNILRQRYDPRFWKRINRLFSLAECSPGRQKLGLLAMMGFEVIAPREGPEAVTEATSLGRRRSF